jgi:glycosyltransferase involved in cell wall biosynthesis
LILIGKFSSPEVERRYRETLRVYGLENRVTYKGYLPHEEIAPYLLDADIGLFLVNGKERYHWGEPIKYFEYALSGLPIVMSDLPAKRALIEKNGNGVLVSPDSAGAAADAVTYLIKNPHQARLMGERGTRAFLEHYHWEAVETRLFDVYDTLLGIQDRLL